eukprot:CAMPEP_0178704592 /NCGR_PEP_ID=MMETSP0699-20121125/14281_1 /TAXON_ID=265572 /ORGANISM="Extubocellulus spinifer, Strain CCMP396" /LENGTH=183 /DNA_ID=CAMNT_0020351987 /DNA_START=176 /DNA_END=727 /DNA_ORIENTATION=-
MPKPRKGGWGLQSVVNGWINVNEQQSSSSVDGRAPPGAGGSVGSSGGPTNITEPQGGEHGPSLSSSGRRRSRREYQGGGLGSASARPATTATRNRYEHSAGYPSALPGDGRVILERRRDSAPEGPDGADSSKWGPEPVPLSPEASPMLSPSLSGPGGPHRSHLLLALTPARHQGRQLTAVRDS